MENQLLSPGQYVVPVTQDHLDEGKGNCTQLCVVALAIKDQEFFNRTPEYVDYISVMPSLVQMTLNGRHGHSYIEERYMMMMTGLCQDFIRTFDDYHRGISNIDLPDPCTLKLFVLGDEFCYMREQTKYNIVNSYLANDDPMIEEDWGMNERKIVMAMMTSDSDDNTHQIKEISDDLGVSDVTSELLLIKEDVSINV